MRDRLCMRCTNYRTAGIHNFPWRAGYHLFVKHHKHQYKLVKATTMLWTTYTFECKIPVCKQKAVVSKNQFFRGPTLIKATSYKDAMKVIADSVNRIQVRPPRMNPSSHFTVRTDGTIEDHTPWLQGQGSNADHPGVEILRQHD